jgi:4-hydroxybenzoyl-CoA thioesterase/acyl-CoA thioester hydrolase
MPPFVIDRRVEYAETDAAGIVHVSEFFRYMEAAEHAYFRSLGLSVRADHGPQPLVWPRASCGFEFHRPLRFEDAFQVRLVVERLGGASLAYRADILLAGDVAATGRSTIVCCEARPDGTMRPVPIPDGIREKLAGACEEG